MHMRPEQMLDRPAGSAWSGPPGISESCLAHWLRAADVEDGARSGVTREESAELRELRERNRLLEQENEVLRKAAAYLAQGNPPGK
jgi:transposase